MKRAARRWPWAGAAWWKTSRTCPVKVGDVDTDMRLICREGLTEAFLLSLEGVQRRGMILPSSGPRCQRAHGDPGSVSPGDATRLSSTPSTRTPAKRAGSSDAACRHGLIWDHTLFHVVPNCRANPAMVAPSKRNCRISQRIARTPKRARGAHTEWFCSMKVTIRQACSRHIQRRLNHRNLAGTPAQGASNTSTTTRP